MKNYSRGAKRRAKKDNATDLPGLAPVVSKKKKSGARNREARQMQEHDLPALRARAVQMGENPNKASVLRDMRNQGLETPAGRALIISMGADIAAPVIETYGAMSMAYQRYARSTGMTIHPKSQKIEMMPDRMEVSGDDPAPDLRSMDERDEAASRAWDIWRDRLARLTIVEGSAIWSAYYGWAELHRGKVLTSAGERFVSAMVRLHDVSC